MDRVDIIRKLIVNGSDELVQAVYERMCADRVVEAPGVRAPAGGAPSTTWRELAWRAVADGTLTPGEALLLLDPKEPAELQLPRAS
jgi:hypothetical protein